MVQWLVQSNKRGGREGRKEGRIKLCKKLNPKRLELNARERAIFALALESVLGDRDN